MENLCLELFTSARTLVTSSTTTLKQNPTCLVSASASCWVILCEALYRYTTAKPALDWLLSNLCLHKAPSDWIVTKV